MEDITLAHLHQVTGGGAAWDATKAFGGTAAKWGGKILRPLNAVNTAKETYDTWKTARGQGDGVFKAGAKAADTALSDSTLVYPLAKEALSVRPAY